MLSDKLKMSRLTPFALAALFCAGTASAEISDTIHPFVALGYTYDDNLLRTPDDFPSNDQRSDRATQAQAGVTVDRPIGRQRLTGRAKVSRVTFDHYDQLDYNGKDFAADLAWQLGNRLSGNLGGTYIQSLTPFSDFHSSERNLRTQRTQNVSAAWRFHPSWQVRGSFVRNKWDYELAAQRLNNRKEDLSEAGVDYLAASGSKVGLVARQLKGTYENPRRVGNFVLNDDYKQEELKANVNWLFSGITQITVLAGYAKRTHNTFVSRDTSGANGRVSVRWSPSGKLSFTADAWREFAAVESTVVTNSLNKGASIGAMWNISAKLQATANVRRDKRDFEEMPGVVLAGEARDRVEGATLGLTWAPTRTIQLSANAFRDKRSGSPVLGTANYTANGVSLNASASF